MVRGLMTDSVPFFRSGFSRNSAGDKNDESRRAGDCTAGQREMNIDVLTWDDAQIEYNMNRNPDSAPGSYLPYQSQLNSFRDFLTQGCAGKEMLDLGTDAASSDESSENGDRKEAKKKEEERAGSLILIEEVSSDRIVWPGRSADRIELSDHIVAIKGVIARGPQRDSGSPVHSVVGRASSSGIASRNATFP